MKKSHIHVMPKNEWIIFRMGEVDARITNRMHFECKLDTRSSLILQTFASFGILHCTPRFFMDGFSVFSREENLQVDLVSVSLANGKIFCIESTVRRDKYQQKNKLIN